MGKYNTGSATTTNFTDVVKSYQIPSLTPDQPNMYGEGWTWYDFPDANDHYSYYIGVPEIFSALKALSTYVCGQGWTADGRTTIILNRIIGWGEDTFVSICRNLFISMKVFGDAFAEIVRDEDDGALINLKPLYTGNMRVVIDDKGIIDHYEIRNQFDKSSKSGFKVLDKNKVLHLCNGRIANEIHGISVVTILKKYIDAKQEALDDEIKIRHRDKALGIAYYDTDDSGKITYANSQIEKAVNKGEMLGLPKDTVKIEEFPSKSPADRILWLQYLDGQFYEKSGVPKVVATSEGYSEAGAKVGIFTFDPVYTSEQRELEADLWNQISIKVTFNPAPSLGGTLQQSEAANTGQTQFQPSDTQVKTTRTE